jgi:hypothetical protein
MDGEEEELTCYRFEEVEAIARNREQLRDLSKQLMVTCGKNKEVIIIEEQKLPEIDELFSNLRQCSESSVNYD